MNDPMLPPTRDEPPTDALRLQGASGHPTFSVVTPVLNDSRVLRACASVQNQQHFGNVEHVIVDGGSNGPVQDLLDELEGAPNVTVLRGRDRGIYDGMNRGVDAASGELVGVLNADDRYEDPFVLRDVSRAFLETGRPLIYGDIVHVNRHDRVVRYWRSGPPSSWRIRTGWIPPHPAVFLMRSVFESCGPFDLKYRIAADYEFLLRAILLHGIQATYVPRVVSRMELGGVSTRSPKALLEGIREVSTAWRANGLRGGYLASIGKPLRKLPQLVSRPRSMRSRAALGDDPLGS